MQKPSEIAYLSLQKDLHKKGFNPFSLIEILEGNRLPLGERHREPYIPLCVASNSIGDHQDRIVIARNLGELLDLGIDRRDIGNNPDRLTFNALMLAHSLGYTDQLAEPLGRLYARKTLSGSYNGKKLVDVLRMAIEQNQPDSRYEQVWINMLNGVGDDFLGGTPRDGFSGAVYMPESQETRGMPYITIISYALGKMASVLESLDDRQKQFTEILYTAVHAYLSGGEKYFEDMSAQAKLHNWPDWAREVLQQHKEEIIRYDWA